MGSAAADSQDYPVLLYDGTCGLCAKSVQLVLRHDLRGIVRFAPLQGRYGERARARWPELHDIDSVVWLYPAAHGHPERALVRSDAVLAAAGYLGGWWKLALLGYVVPRPLRDAAYAFIARHRHRVLGMGASCLVPAADVRERFLE